MGHDVRDDGTVNQEKLTPDGAESSFESIYAQLEQAVARLESGGLELEQSIDVYESGMRLARRCKEMLEAAELRVTELEQELTGSIADQTLGDQQ